MVREARLELAPPLRRQNPNLVRLPLRVTPQKMVATTDAPRTCDPIIMSDVPNQLSYAAIFFRVTFIGVVGRIMRIGALKRQPLFIENAGKCLFG